MSPRPDRPPRVRIDIDVDALVLHGIPRRQAPLVLAALEARLGELAAEAEPAALARLAPADHPHRPAPAARPADGGPDALGRAVAESVWATVGGADRGGGRP